MIWARNRKAIDDGILMSQTGPVHREVGEHRTGCGDAIPLRSIPVSDAQIERLVCAIAEHGQELEVAWVAA